MPPKSKARRGSNNARQQPRKDPSPIKENSNRFMIPYPSVLLDEMAPGNICFLPNNVQVLEEVRCVRQTPHMGKDRPCQGDRLRDKAYWHMIVILGLYHRSTTPGDIVARFQIISSYEKTELDNYIAVKGLRKFFQVLPIRQDHERPQDGVFKDPDAVNINTIAPTPRGCSQLELSKESQLLREQSYVDIAHQWECSIRYIWPWKWRPPYNQAYAYRMSRDSYYVLAAKVGIQPQFYPPIDDLIARTSIWRRPPVPWPVRAPTGARIDSSINLRSNNVKSDKRGRQVAGEGSSSADFGGELAMNSGPFQPRLRSQLGTSNFGPPTAPIFTPTLASRAGLSPQNPGLPPDNSDLAPPPPSATAAPLLGSSLYLISEYGDHRNASMTGRNLPTMSLRDAAWSQEIPLSPSNSYEYFIPASLDENMNPESRASARQF
ncbi:uncharacterized protein PAC_09427 [Phialocephala subalpina]|uniref:Uncharacterized protein n=1 Tax=Phialocephala subalpina TaxID=576137 RepID=A0A1L7X3C4_9HELO|nr:uncharacterized protein PAC_09427 [Phialocephala subalpina]